jgi:hypothetical protein
MLFKNSVRTPKRTPHFTITKINWLILFTEIMAVYSENHATPINTKCIITECQSRWFIQLSLRLKGLNDCVSNSEVRLALLIWGRSQWPRGLRRRPWTLRPWIRIPLKVWMSVLVCSSSSFTFHPVIDAMYSYY